MTVVFNPLSRQSRKTFAASFSSDFTLGVVCLCVHVGVCLCVCVCLIGIVSLLAGCGESDGEGIEEGGWVVLGRAGV